MPSKFYDLGDGRYLEDDVGIPEEELPGFLESLISQPQQLGSMESDRDPDISRSHMYQYITETLPDAASVVGRYLTEDPTTMDSPITEEEFRNAGLEILTGIFGGSRFGPAGGPGVTGTFVGNIGRSRLGKTPKKSFDESWEEVLKEANVYDAPNNAQKQLRLEKAQDLMWERHGAYKAPDGEWRTELLDHEAEWIGENWFVGDKPKFGKTKLPEKIYHPELYEAYPELINWDIRIRQHRPGDPRGQANAEKKEITIFTQGDEVDDLKIAMHEIQHAVQDVESFAVGGNQRTVFKNIQEDLNREKQIYKNELEKLPQGSEGVLPEGTEALRLALETKIAKVDKNLEQVAAWGGKMPKDKKAFQQYKRLWGEIESRNVEWRQAFLKGTLPGQRVPGTPEQLAQIGPHKTQDIKSGPFYVIKPDVENKKEGLSESRGDGEGPDNIDTSLERRRQEREYNERKERDGEVIPDGFEDSLSLFDELIDGFDDIDGIPQEAFDFLSRKSVQELQHNLDTADLKMHIMQRNFKRALAKALKRYGDTNLDFMTMHDGYLDPGKFIESINQYGRKRGYIDMFDTLLTTATHRTDKIMRRLEGKRGHLEKHPEKIIDDIKKNNPEVFTISKEEMKNYMKHLGDVEDKQFYGELNPDKIDPDSDHWKTVLPSDTEKADIIKAIEDAYNTGSLDKSDYDFYMNNPHMF